MKYFLSCATLFLALSAFSQWDTGEPGTHQHDAEKLGTVSFPTSCACTRCLGLHPIILCCP